MSLPHLFIDTNILIYAHDLDAGIKREIGSQFVEALFRRPYPPAVSVQILNELYVNILRKGSSKSAADICESYTDWEVIPLTIELFRGAVITRSRYKISFWDSLVVEASKKARANRIISEDLSHGQEYCGIEVVNPFKLGADWKQAML